MVPKPTRTSTKARLSKPASARGATPSRAAKESEGSGRCGAPARASTTMPSSANAMAVPQRRKNFHAASVAAGVRCIATISTASSVPASMATQSRPKLSERSARLWEARNAWNAAW